MDIKEKANIIKGILFIFLVFTFIIFIISVSSSINFKNLHLNLIFYSLGKLMGLIGFLFLSFIIISGDTARYFDRFFGIDKIIIFQRKFSLIITLFVILHPVFFILSSRSILPYIIPEFSVIPLALGIISLYIFLIIMLTSLLYKRISYKIWQYIHILTYLLFFFSLYHAIKIGSDSSNLFIQRIYLLLSTLIIMGIAYRTYYKLKQRTSKFIVKEVKLETKDTFTLILKSNKKFNFKAGQFCFLRLNKKGIYARHPISISSSPDEKDLKFTIKLKGNFTKEAQNLKIGEKVIVEGPFGIFTIEDTTERYKNKKLVFIAGGVGITPFHSMIKSQIKSNIKRNITLFYCSKTIKGTIFKKELDNINEDWFKKIYIVSEDECQENVKEKGIINKDLIKKHLDEEKVKNSVFYICGPEKMKDLVVKELKEIGVKKENIIIEDFFW